MIPDEAIAFAIDKLNNEVERDFDGSDVSDVERNDYQDALETLSRMLSCPGTTCSGWTTEGPDDGGFCTIHGFEGES